MGAQGHGPFGPMGPGDRLDLKDPGLKDPGPMGPGAQGPEIIILMSRMIICRDDKKLIIPKKTYHPSFTKKPVYIFLYFLHNIGPHGGGPIYWLGALGPPNCLGGPWAPQLLGAPLGPLGPWAPGP